MRAKIVWTLGATIFMVALFPVPQVWRRSAGLSRAFSSTPGLSGIHSLPEVEKEVERLTNATRREHGLPLLTADPNLQDASRQHSLDMLRRRFFGHSNPEGLSPLERLLLAYASRISRSGENIWTGSCSYLPAPPALARMMMAAWMSSPGHRQNILNPGFSRLGVGVAGCGREVRATQIFVAVAPFPGSKSGR